MLKKCEIDHFLLKIIIIHDILLIVNDSYYQYQLEKDGVYI